MKRNKILYITLQVAKLIKLLMIIVIILLLVVAIHWHFDKDFYSNLYLSNNFQAGYSFGFRHSYKELAATSLNKLAHVSLYWFVFRSILILLISIYITSRYIKILNSVKNFKTFYDKNILAFRNVALGSLFLAFISSFNFGLVENQTTWNFTIPFGILIFAVINIVLSEIFIEGQNHLKDSQSII